MGRSLRCYSGGGIGTGTISIGGRGDLRDWEIMNRGALGFLPAFKLVNPTIADGPFFALYYKKADEQKGNIKILEGPIAIRDYYGDWGGMLLTVDFRVLKKPLSLQLTLWPGCCSRITASR